jgi:hypothetical protein
VADDPQLLDLIRESGCRQVLIGLESPRSEGLDGLELRGNWKLKQIDRYEAAIHAIQRQGDHREWLFHPGVGWSHTGYFLMRCMTIQCG